MRPADRIRPLICGLLIGLCVCGSATGAESLPRRLDFGWSLDPLGEAASGARVGRIAKGGPAERAGVRAGDLVIEANGVPIRTPDAVSALRFSGPPGRQQRLVLQRGRDRVLAEIEPREAPREIHQGLVTEWGSIGSSSGLLLRTIVTRPKHTSPTPAIFVVGWLSCDSVEIPPSDTRDTIAALLRDLAERSGATLFRVDKPGCGDSEGNCGSTDFLMELDGYRRAFAAMRSDPDIDPSRILVVGISNGGGFAPLVVADAPVAGYVTIGAWSKTWFEHMVDLERRRLALTGTPASQIDSMMAKLTEFHAAYLFDQMTPAQIVKNRRHLSGIWYDEPESQYGRPARFYHQLQQLNLSEAWGKVRVPTLVVWGEYDWIMDRADQEQIVRLVNGNGSELASLLIVPRTDHTFGVHGDPQSAFDHMGEGKYPAEAADRILRFVRRVAKLD